MPQPRNKNIQALPATNGATPHEKRAALELLRRVQQAPPRDEPIRCYALMFEDGPFPIYQPVIVMPDDSEHLLVDAALAPVWFLSMEHLRAYALVGGYTMIAPPDDATGTLDGAGDEGPE
jgi:hypothetical protein